MSDNKSSRYIMSKKALLAACILSAAGALVFNAFPLFLSTIADQWKLSDAQLGLLGSAYLGGFALIALGAVLWMPRFNWKTTGLVAYLLIGAGVMGFSLTGKTSAVFASMALLGVGSGTIFTLALGVLSRATNPDRAYGLKISAEMIAASILVFAMTSLVIKHFGFQGFAYGTILLYGLSAFSIILLPHNFMKTEEDAFESDTAVSDGSINPAGWFSVIALFIQFAAFSALWGFMERIGADIGVAAGTIGTILTLSVIFGLGGAMLGAALGNRFEQAKPLGIILLSTIATVWLLAYSKGTMTFAVAACAINALLQLSVVYQMALVTVADQTGKFTVMMAFILSFGGAVGPGVAGFLKTEESYLPVYIAVCIVTVVSLLITFQVNRIQKKKA